MMKIHIYQIWFSTSKKSYIGQTKDIKKRMQQHLHSGSLVCKALWKYDDWQIEVLHTCKTRDEANRIEIEEIRHYNCVAPNGYNLTRGGDNPPDHTGKKRSKDALKKMQGNQNAKGCKHSEEANKNKSKRLQGNKNAKEKHTEETIEKMKKSHQGLHHSKETAGKISKALEGYKHSAETKKKIQIGQLKRRIRELTQEEVKW